MHFKYPRYQFAFFRVVFGVYLLVHFMMLLPEAGALFARGGLLSDPSLNLSYGAFPSILYVFTDVSQVTLFVGVMTLLSLLVIFGYFRRTASVLLWYGWACLFHQNNLILNPGLPMVGWLLLALALIPKGEGFGFEKREEKWQMPPMLYWGAWAIAGIAYTISGLDKAMAPSWQDGSAITHLLNNPLARDYFLREWLLSAPEWFRQLLTWATLALEIGFGFLILFSKTRLLAWLMIIAMHLGIISIVDFADLTFGVLMLHFFTFDGSWFQTKAKERIIIFDGICGFCNKSLDVLMKLDEEKIFKYTSLQGKYVKGLHVEEGLASIIFYKDGTLYYKSTAILKILRSLGGVWIVVNIFYLIPRVVRDAIYDVIAKYRYNIFGKMDACRMPKKGEAELFID